MDQPRWIPQLYGYTVCLVAVITILISVSSLVNNVFEYAAPEMSHEVRYRAMHALVTSSFMLLLALGLFGLHWRWLRTSRATMA